MSTIEDIITDDVTNSCNNVVDATLRAAEKNVPASKSSKNPTRKPVSYWTDEYTAAVKERNNSKNKMQQTRNLIDQQAYYKLKGVAQRVVKDAKQQHWRDYCSTLYKTSKIGKVWKAVKKMNGVETKRSIPTLKEDDFMYDNNQSKAELLAKKFASVISNNNLSVDNLTRRMTFEQQHIQSVAPSGESNDTTTDDDAINTPFEPHELREALCQCKKNSCGGDDRLTYELLKEVPKKSHGTIFKFNNIWQRGRLPPD